MSVSWIRDGTGGGFLAKVTSDNRVLTDGISEPLSAERSRTGKLFGAGTGSLTLGAGFSGPVLWFKNDDPDEHLYVQKLIFGWNGGTSSRNTTLFSLISYQGSEPSSANTAIDFAVENISRFGTTALETAHKWDGSGSTGMGGITGETAQIPNRLSIGNHSIPIDGEIILGQGDSMQFDFTPDEAGVGQISVVAYWAPPGGRSAI